VVHAVDEVMMPANTFHTVRKALDSSKAFRTAVRLQPAALGRALEERGRWFQHAAAGAAAAGTAAAAGAALQQPPAGPLTARIRPPAPVSPPPQARVLKKQMRDTLDVSATRSLFFAPDDAAFDQMTRRQRHKSNKWAGNITTIKMRRKEGLGVAVMKVRGRARLRLVVRSF
jgi:hypothetical protein